MENFVCCIFVVATLAAFVVTLLHKWGAVEYMQVHGWRLFSDMAKCDFCLSWWVGLVVSMSMVAIGKMELVDGVLVAVCATPVARFLL